LGISQYFQKNPLNKKKESGILKDALLIIFSVSLASIAQMLLRYGMIKVGRISSIESVPSKLLTAFTNPFVLLGLFVFGISALSWLIVLSRVKLSIAYPMVSFGYAAVVIFSWLVFKEPLKLVPLIGCATVIFGVFLISRGL
jgi:multidrug transporter EmrE-like cation transporter